MNCGALRRGGRFSKTSTSLARGPGEYFEPSCFRPDASTYFTRNCVQKCPSGQHAPFQLISTCAALPSCRLNSVMGG